jgi:quercetin dioxygenase-like cupin family protein
MVPYDLARRSILFSGAGLAVERALSATPASAQTTAPEGYVLGPNDGEHLIQRGGNLFIKVDPTKGANGLAMGTQQVLVGVGIPIHRHFEFEEAFYIVDGSGTFILNDVRHPIEKGVTIFIPRKAWHGFENPDRELLLLWTVAPPGLEGFSARLQRALACRQHHEQKSRSTRLRASMQQSSDELPMEADDENTVLAGAGFAGVQAAFGVGSGSAAATRDLLSFPGARRQRTRSSHAGDRVSTCPMTRG